MTDHSRLDGWRNGRASRLGVMALVAAAALLGLAGTSGADVPSVSGSAFGASGNVLIVPLGGTLTLAPTPSVTLPPGGGNVTDTAPSVSMASGPVDLLETGPLTVSTQGTTAGAGSVTSSALVQDIGPGPFTAGSASSTCTASGTSVTGSAQIVNGVVVVSQGADLDSTTDDTTVAVPQNPAPNTSYDGVIESSGGDTFTIVFNEQVVTANSIVVNAVHLILHGPNAIGDIYIAQSVCGPADTTPTTLICNPGTNPRGEALDVCTFSDPDGIRSIQIRNVTTGALQANVSFDCSNAPTSAVVRVPANTKYKVVVVDCSSPRHKTSFVIRANGAVRRV